MVTVPMIDISETCTRIVVSLVHAWVICYGILVTFRTDYLSGPSEVATTGIGFVIHNRYPHVLVYIDNDYFMLVLRRKSHSSL